MLWAEAMEPHHSIQVCNASLKGVRGIIKGLCSIKIYDETPLQNCLTEVVLKRGHNMFYLRNKKNCL